jgi:hypothetical protein
MKTKYQTRLAEWSAQSGPSSQGLAGHQRGLKVLVKGRRGCAFGDTGTPWNVISDRQLKELALKMSLDPKFIPMGNSKKIFSPGTVEVPIAFEDDPTNIWTIVARVIHNFAYDLLLGNEFLKQTMCLTDYIHRFVPCLFFGKSRWSMNLLGKTTNRFHGKLGNGIEVSALPDIGSCKNVMNYHWFLERAKAGGFEFLSGPEHRG